MPGKEPTTSRWPRVHESHVVSGARCEGRPARSVPEPSAKEAAPACSQHWPGAASAPAAAFACKRVTAEQQGHKRGGPRRAGSAPSALTTARSGSYRPWSCRSQHPCCHGGERSVAAADQVIAGLLDTRWQAVESFQAALSAGAWFLLLFWAARRSPVVGLRALLNAATSMAFAMLATGYPLAVSYAAMAVLLACFSAGDHMLRGL